MNATTFANGSLLQDGDNSIFISVNNTIFVIDFNKRYVLIWLQENIQPPINLSVGHDPRSLFVAINGDIYAKGEENGEVNRYILNPSNKTKVAKFSDRCFGLFIDVNNMLYCSVPDLHIVERVSLKYSENTLTTIAGKKRCPGNTSDKLHSPYGIFIHTNLSLYVADYTNNRIQHFLPGQTSGTTVTQNNCLNNPTAVILDGNDNLFIADHNNNRIVKSGPDGCRHLFGRSTNPREGSAADQLNKPYALAFDRQGNIYVVDKNNKRIQKFALISNTCSKYSNIFLYI